MEKYEELKHILLANSKGFIPCEISLEESDLIENSCHYFALLCHLTFNDSLCYVKYSNELFVGGHAFLKTPQNKYFDARLELYSSSTNLLGQPSNSLKEKVSVKDLVETFDISSKQLSLIKKISKLYKKKTNLC